MQPLSDSLQSVERALRVVEVLVHEGRPMSVREISEQIGINRTTAHRLVATLCASGWAERAPDGTVRLEPPEGGYLVTSLALPDAMRLLGGRHRRAAVAGVIGLGLAIGLLAVGGIGAVGAALLG